MKKIMAIKAMQASSEENRQENYLRRCIATRNNSHNKVAHVRGHHCTASRVHALPLMNLLTEGSYYKYKVY